MGMGLCLFSWMKFSWMEPMSVTAFALQWQDWTILTGLQSLNYLLCGFLQIPDLGQLFQHMPWVREAFLQKGLCQGGSDWLFQDIKNWKSPKSPRIGEESGNSKDTHTTNWQNTIIDNVPEGSVYTGEWFESKEGWMSPVCTLWCQLWLARSKHWINAEWVCEGNNFQWESWKDLLQTVYRGDCAVTAEEVSGLRG